MFFLLPRVTVVLIAAFGLLLAWRMWRPRQGRKAKGSRRRRAARSYPLVPAALLKGADRTWVIFTAPGGEPCDGVAERLRAAEPGSQISQVDARREPRLVEAFGLKQLPALLLANRYGQVEARLVGLPAIEAYHLDDH